MTNRTYATWQRPSDYWCNDDAQVKAIEAALDLYEISSASSAMLDQLDHILCEEANRVFATAESYYLHGLWHARVLLRALKNAAPQNGVHEKQNVDTGSAAAAPASETVAVPREPTEAMLIAGNKAGPQLIGAEWPARIYRAMLAAAQGEG